MIGLNEVTAAYGREVVLHDVNLHVARGEYVGLIGPNGCGKTTLLRVISGLVTPRQGTVCFDGQDLKTIERRALARKMACLPQDQHMDFAFTAREIVLMGRWPHLRGVGGESRKDFAVAGKAMELTNVTHLADRPITELSGGERQRVGIAMCLAQEPEVVLLDEPTSHLDLGQQLSVMNLLRELNRTHNMTVVSVLHDLNMAAEYCQRLVLLDGGRIVAAGIPSEVLTPAALLRVFKAKMLVERDSRTGTPRVIVSGREIA